MSEKKLVRNMEKKMICGVCAGIADYFNVDPTLVRIIIVALGVFTNFAMVLFYIIAAFVIPEGESY